MDKKKREQNEHKFENWEDFKNGGRRYSYTVAGRYGWSARYVKEVDANEKTVRFYQEIYNEKGELIELHQKYPQDTGHQTIAKE